MLHVLYVAHIPIYLWSVSYIKDIEDIKSLCELGLKNVPGIRTLSFTDAKNMSALGEIAPGSTIYSVSFRSYSGQVDDDHSTSGAGDSYTKTATIYVPRYRYTCERIVQELVDRKVVVFVTDRNGDEHVIHYARFASRFSTGKRAGDSNGYEWTFSGRDRKKRFFANTSLTELTGEGYTPAAGDQGPLEPAEDPAIPVLEDCCVTVLVTPVPEAPLPEGNILNLNKFVTVVGTGEKYFIDKHGVSIKVSGGGMKIERVLGSGASVYTLTRDYNPEKVIINRTQNVLIHEAAPPPTEIHTYHIDGDQLILPDDWPLESGEYIEIYEIAA